MDFTCIQLSSFFLDINIYPFWSIECYDGKVVSEMAPGPDPFAVFTFRAQPRGAWNVNSSKGQIWIGPVPVVWSVQVHGKCGHRGLQMTLLERRTCVKVKHPAHGCLEIQSISPLTAKLVWISRQKLSSAAVWKWRPDESATYVRCPWSHVSTRCCHWYPLVK